MTPAESWAPRSPYDRVVLLAVAQHPSGVFLHASFLWLRSCMMGEEVYFADLGWERGEGLTVCGEPIGSEDSGEEDSGEEDSKEG